jgi:hypothetical protein
MNLLIYLIAIGLIWIGCMVGFFIIARKNRILSNRKAILYYLGVGLFITAVGFLGLIPAVASSMLYFVLLQVFFLGLGFLVSYLWRKNSIEDFQHSTSRNSGILFIFANAALGTIGFTILFYYCSKTDLAIYYGLSVIPFVLPHFISASFAKFKEIPHEIYKVWYFPLEEDEIDFNNIDTSSIYILELIYSKSANDNRLMNTKLRAPIHMKFGDWFRSFIEKYNRTYNADPIHYRNEDHSSMGWIFYVKPPFLGSARYIDPDKTIAENKILEKKAIIARRVKYVEEV